MAWKWWDDLKANAKTRWAQYNNANFKNAVTAAAALVSSADGNVSNEEINDVVELMKTNEMLQVFNAEELGKLFMANCEKAKNKFARIELFKPIAALANDKSAGDAVVQICCILGASDGNFDDNEKKVVREICMKLGIDSTNYV
jgi:tellurite resistance protein TerB